MEKAKQREIWVDNVKVIACVLVVLGHFFQSLTAANILPANDLYQWFNQTIYYFHVPLFFICSGYLYQKLSIVNNIQSWKKNAIKKAINLGIPYFIFSIITWVMKEVFSGSINGDNRGLLETLFLHPTGQYWYLYALFFCFLVTSTFINKSTALIGLIITLSLKLLGIAGIGSDILPMSYIRSNDIWLVIGMCLGVFEIKNFLKKQTLIIPAMTGIIFLLLSILLYVNNDQNGFVGFFMGLLACATVIATMIKLSNVYRKQSPIFKTMAKYTLPIFLMHTMFSAALRIVLLKMGINIVIAHVFFGLIINFIGPMVAATIMEKIKWLNVLLYPGKFIKA